MNEALREKKVALPKSVATVTEADRGEKGFLTQKSIFPAGLDGMYQSSPENRKHVAEYLASFCFGDFYTRGALDIKTREILTLCIISAQGGCESQVKSHVQANFNVGNDETTMIEAITQCLPYMGFPADAQRARLRLRGRRAAEITARRLTSSPLQTLS